MALIDAGLSDEDIARAVRSCIATMNELPTVADIIAQSRQQQRQLIDELRCPVCGSSQVIVDGGVVLGCGRCEYEAKP